MKGRALVAVFTVAALVPVVMGSVAKAGTDVAPAGIAVSTPVPATFASYGGIRLQAIGSHTNTADEFLGVSDLTPASNRVEANFTVPRFTTNQNSGATSGDCRGDYAVGTVAAPSPNALTLTWDASAGTLTSQLVNPTLSCTIVFRDVAQELANANGWTLAHAQSALSEVDSLALVVDGRQTGTKVALRGVTVDGGVAVGTFDPGAGTSKDWLASGYDYDAPNGFTVSGTVDLGGTFGACETTCAVELRFGHSTPANRPPSVLVHGPDASGHEGDALDSRGSFTDPDGDPLTISGSGAGSVIDHGNGSWSWHLVPSDDGNGSVTVTAADGKGGSATDVFSWHADNVPPTIVSLTPSATTVLAGADVTWTATATDPGTADTFTWWFDGGAVVPGDLTTTFTTRYAACGTYGLDAKIADDDGGSDSATSRSTVTVAEGGVLPPLGSGGVNMVQPGQVVPVKVQIGCGGASWSGLAPAIDMVHDGEVSPAVSVAASDAPGVMREVQGMYLYNLRIPSTIGGHDLLKGDQLTIQVEPFGPAGGTIDLIVQVRK